MRVPECEINYFYVADSAVDEGKGFDSFEAIHDCHGSEVFEDEFNGVDLIHLFPDIVLEAIHAFLVGATVTMISRRALSVFLLFSPGAYISN